MTSPVRTQIRIPGDLYERIVEAADASARSINAEMIVRLESSFRQRQAPDVSEEEKSWVLALYRESLNTEGGLIEALAKELAKQVRLLSAEEGSGGDSTAPASGKKPRKSVKAN